MVTIWTQVQLTSGPGPELLGSTTALSQTVAIFPGSEYTLEINVGGTTGTIDVFLGGDLVLENIDAGAGPSTYSDLVAGSSDSLLLIVPSFDFDGTITGLSLKQNNVVTAWNPISLPTLPTWTTVATPSGSWTTVPKPSDTTTVSYGTPYGLLLAILRPVTVTTDTWIRVGSPSTNWTIVPKAT